MSVLLTGASSFSGLWFAETLAAAGIRVIAPIQRSVGDYEGIRAQRVQRLAAVADIVENCSFGSDAFIALMQQNKVQVLCHHAAQLANHRSPDFDVIAALSNNTHNLRQVLEEAPDLRSVILTGTVFEANEGGVDSAHIEAFSPYGLSKTLSSSMFRYWCATNRIPLTRFIIPHPFGPFEEFNFCSYLMNCWGKGEVARVKTPDHFLDNIPVSLMAKAYADCVKRILSGEVIAHVAPSGYVGRQGAFAQRVAHEMSCRLNWACALEMQPQSPAAQPVTRTNSDKLDATALGWDANQAWDGLAEYYRDAKF
jgi:nucleoside-diphosphate-sugar epimerase